MRPIVAIPFVLYIICACSSSSLDAGKVLGDTGDDTGLTIADADTDTDTDADADADTDTDAPLADRDLDGIPDDIDNCPDTYNPGQESGLYPGYGNACPPDSDGDGVPDHADPYPNDPTWPGRGSNETIYAHTASTLFTYHVNTGQLTQVSGFSFNRDSDSVTDVALDQYGVLYAVTFDDLFVCQPQSATCRWLGALPGSFNGLSFIPQGVLDPAKDTLVGVAQNGQFFRFDIVSFSVQTTLLGQYGGGYTNAGDVFSIVNVGTFGAVNSQTGGPNIIVTVNPATGAIIGQLATLPTGYNSIWGLAGWDDAIYAFDSNGGILRIDPFSGAVTVAQTTNHSWWGAGVVTRIPSP